MKKSIIKPLGVLCLSLVSSFAINIPDYVPEWKWVMIGITVLLFLVSIFFAVKLVKNINETAFFNRFKGTKVLIITLLVGVMGVTYFLAFFLAQGGLFAPTLVRKYESKEYHQTFYIYDASWLDPVTIIKVRHSFLPILNEVKLIPQWHPDMVKFEERGDTLRISNYCQKVLVDLKTGKVL